MPRQLQELRDALPDAIGIWIGGHAALQLPAERLPPNCDAGPRRGRIRAAPGETRASLNHHESALQKTPGNDRRLPRCWWPPLSRMPCGRSRQPSSPQRRATSLRSWSPAAGCAQCARAWSARSWQASWKALRSPRATRLRRASCSDGCDLARPTPALPAHWLRCGLPRPTCAGRNPSSRPPCANSSGRRNLPERKLVPVAELDNAEAAERVQRARTDSARALLDEAAAEVDKIRPEFGKREVRAPFSGIVVERMVEPGTSVSAATAWFSVAEMSDDRDLRRDRREQSWPARRSDSRQSPWLRPTRIAPLPRGSPRLGPMSTASAASSGCAWWPRSSRTSCFPT